MNRIDHFLRLLKTDEEKAKQFTILESEDDTLVLRSQARMGKTDVPLQMLIIVRNGAQFCELVARICTFSDKETESRMMQYANFIQNNYSGIRAGVQLDDEFDEHFFYTSIENFYEEDDPAIESVFYLDGYLTHVIAEEYDNIMRVLYSL